LSSENLEQLGEAHKIMYYRGIEPNRISPSHDDQEEEPDYQKPDPAKHSTPPAYVLCLGIGKISESRESQFQYLQLQDIAAFFNVRQQDTYFQSHPTEAYVFPDERCLGLRPHAGSRGHLVAGAKRFQSSRKKPGEAVLQTSLSGSRNCLTMDRIRTVNSHSWDVIYYLLIGLRLPTFRIVQGVFTKLSCERTGPHIGSDGESNRMI
jgi:hypothetical protein